jgi:Ca2+-binding RTX toxin-like protein
MSLTNYGKIVGNIVLNTLAHDIIVNKGNIIGIIQLGNDDVFSGRGGTSGPIYAGSGSDLIIAGKGKAFIHVGGGNNTLTAGTGHDQFIFDSPMASQVETIANFRHGSDKIVLNYLGGGFGGIGPIGGELAPIYFHVGPHATTASQHIIYNPGTGFLFYDDDGNGPDQQIHFATVHAPFPLSHSDFLVSL